MRRTVAVVCAVLLSGFVLQGCGAKPEEIADTSWQVVGVYTTPNYPATVPDAVAGAVAVNFGATTISGFTGCAPLQGTVSFTQAGKPANSVDGDALHVEKVSYRQVDEEQCTGHIRFVHDAIVRFFEHHDFAVSRPTGGELLLTVSGSELYDDAPALRLVH